MPSCGLVPALVLTMLGTACTPAQREPAVQPAAPAAGQSPAPAQVSEPSVDGDEAARAEVANEAAVVAAIEQAVNQTRTARHDCWARAAADDYRLAGRVSLRVQFAREAPRSAPTVTIIDDEPGDPVLSRCLVAVYQAHAWPASLPPGTAIELPFAFEAPRYQYTVRAEDVAPVDPDSPELRKLLHEPNTGNDDIALMLLTMELDLDMPEPRIILPVPDGATVLLYVLAGEVELRPGVLPGEHAAARQAKASPGTHMGAGQAISLPPGTLPSMRPVGAAPARVVAIFASPGPDAPATDIVRPALRRNARRTRLPAVQTRPQVFPIAGGQAEVGIFYDRAGGHEAASLATFTARPGLRIPAHVHERETEVVLILDGAGTMTIDGETYPIGPMTAVQIPPGVEHAVVFEGDAPVRALQVYTPSGPEQRFKQPPQP